MKHVLKGIMCVVLLMAGITVCWGQTETIKGTVVNEHTQAPLPNISVRIKGSSLATSTDSIGQFKLDKLQQKEYTLIFTCIGFKPVEKKVTAGAAPLTVSIVPGFTELTEVSVFGNKKESPLINTAVQPSAWESSITHIQAADMQNIGATNIASALKYNVGGNVTEQGRKRKEFYSVRGQMTNADFAIDGVSMYYFLEGPSALSTSAIDEIEIVRSSNALLYGYSGMNGVVNLKTKTFDKFHTDVAAEYGTFNTLHAELTHGGKVGNFHYLLSATRDQTDGPKNRNAAERAWNFFGKISYSLKDWLNVELQQFYIKSMREFAQVVSTAEYPVAIGTQSQIWKYDPLNLSLTQGKIKIKESANATTELRYYYIQNKEEWHNRTYVIAKVKGVQTLTSTIKDVVTQEPSFVNAVGFTQVWKPVSENTLRIVGDYYKGDMWTNGAQRKSTLSGVILDEHDFGKLSVNAGIKVLRDYYKYYNPGTALIQNQWQPAYANISAGAAYKLCKNTTLNYIFNAGTVPVPDGSLQQVNGVATTVNNEKRVSMDLGITKQCKEAGDVSLTAFFSNRKNAFQYTGVLYTNTAGTQSEYLQNLDLKSYGVEFEYKSPVVLGFLSGFTNIMWQHTTTATDGTTTKYLNVPDFIASAGINAQKSGFTFNALGRFVNKYIGNRFIVTTPGQMVYVGNYFNLDANLGYTLPKWPVTAYVKIVNAFDVRYATMTPAYPDYGRKFSVGLRASF